MQSFQRSSLLYVPSAYNTVSSPDPSTTCFSSPASDALPTPLMGSHTSRDLYLLNHSTSPEHLIAHEPEHDPKEPFFPEDEDSNPFDASFSAILDDSDRMISYTESPELDASAYCSRFPSGYRLNPHFASLYELGDELGAGGFGFVMTARQREDGFEVAVKFIIKDKVPEHAWMNDESLGRLPTEVLLLSYIDHPNIVKCMDLFEDSLYFYMVRYLYFFTPLQDMTQ